MRPLLLVLMLVIGSVHVQTLFACAMMDTIVHGTCCCDEHKRCADSDINEALQMERKPCCEKSVELSIDQVSMQTTPINKPVEVRSDVDPPPTIAIAAKCGMQVYRVVTVIDRRAIDMTHQSTAQTYLVTQRLRI